MFFSRIQLKPQFYRTTHLAKVLSDSSYNMHRLLWDLFPEEEQRNFLYREEIAREQLGTQAGVRGEPIYYVVSSTRPISNNPIFRVDEREYHPKLKRGDRLRFALRANPVIQKTGQKHDIVMDAQLTFLKSLCVELNLQSDLPDKPRKKEFKNLLLSKGCDALNWRLTELLKNNFRDFERLQQTMQLNDKLEWSLKTVVDTALQNWLVLKGKKHGFTILKDAFDQYKIQNSAYCWHAVKAGKGIKSGFSSIDFVGEFEVTDVEGFTEALFNGVGRSKAFGCGLLLIKRL